MQGLMMNWQLTLDKLIEHANRLYPHKGVTTMQPDGSLHRMTYGEMYKRVKRLAKALVQLGIEPGDRVGTFAWNNYQHLELYYAMPGAGAVCHTLNIRLFPDQLGYIINHAEDKIVFIDGTLLPLYEKLAAQATGVQYHVLFNAPREAAGRLPNTLFYEDLIEGSDEDFTWRSTDENMAMGMCYTSGTTGEPKGALYSHRSMFLHTIGESQVNALGVSEADTVLVVVPQFHAMAWGLPYSAVGAGANLVMPGPHLKPEPLANLITQERVTIAAGVPTIWNGLYHELKQHPRDISCVRALVVGGAAMPRSLTQAYESELGVNVLHAWGMTEMSPLGTVSRLSSAHLDLDKEQQWDVKAKQGYPILGVELRIVDEVGEVAALGRQDHGRAAGARAVDHPPVFQARGHHGLHDEGRLVPHGRRRDDQPRRLHDHHRPHQGPGQERRRVDLDGGAGEHYHRPSESPRSRRHRRSRREVVRAAAGGRRAHAGRVGLTEEDVLAYVGERAPKFWVPDRVIFIDEVPKTSVGQVRQEGAAPHVRGWAAGVKEMSRRRQAEARSSARPRDMDCTRVLRLYFFLLLFPNVTNSSSTPPTAAATVSQRLSMPLEALTPLAITGISLSLFSASARTRAKYSGSAR